MEEDITTTTMEIMRVTITIMKVVNLKAKLRHLRRKVHAVDMDTLTIMLIPIPRLLLTKRRDTLTTMPLKQKEILMSMQLSSMPLEI